MFIVVFLFFVWVDMCIICHNSETPLKAEGAATCQDWRDAFCRAFGEPDQSPFSQISSSGVPRFGFSDEAF